MTVDDTPLPPGDESLNGRVIVGSHAPYRVGWECPRCDRVWSPDEQGCVVCNALVASGER